MKKHILQLHDVSFKFSKDLPYFFHKIQVNFESGKINFIQGSNGVENQHFLESYIMIFIHRSRAKGLLFLTINSVMVLKKITVLF